MTDYELNTEETHPDDIMLTTQEVEATNPLSEEDWEDAMPFICNNTRSDGTVCENIIESIDDLYAPHNVSCGTCFNDAEKQGD